MPDYYPYDRPDSSVHVLALPESIREEVLEYRTHVDAFLRGETSAIAFRAYRVPMGVYEQRTSGRYMVRVRIAAGIALPEQLRTLARLSSAYGNGVLHLTTRQDIQIHDVVIEDTPPVMEGLLQAGLSSRGGGGNTVRNISASISGVCPTEKFDVAPYAVALAEYLLQHQSSFNLPRKYKIAFSGCDDDCGQASIADLGFFAQVRDGKRGFSVFAGGGMGLNPKPAIQMEDFVTPEEIFEIAEAVRRLFDRHGDRANKHKARLRFAVSRLGEETFRELYRQERAALKKDGLPGTIPKTKAASQAEGSQGCPSSASTRIRLPLGDITAEDLNFIADLAQDSGSAFFQTTQHQDLILTTDKEDAPRILASLARRQLTTDASPAPKIVACTGAATCKLGLCLSQGLANAILDVFRRRGLKFNDKSQVIRISGCPNSCGGHQIGAIGLEGGARRVEGRLMPVYALFLNGRLSRDGATLAEKIAAIPAKRVPDLLADAFVDGRVDPQKLRGLAPLYEALPATIPEEYFSDFGASEPFSLAGRGPGECGAGVLDIVRVDIDEARAALRAVPSEKDPAAYRALVAATRSLLVIFGVEARKDREVFAAFNQHLVEPGWVSHSATDLVSAAIDWRLGDRESISELSKDIADLVERVQTLFQSLDGNLKFRATPLELPQSSPVSSYTLDLSGVACPINFAKAKVALERLHPGDTLEVLLDDGAPAQNVPASFAEQGQEVLTVEPVQDAGKPLRHLLRVRRKK